MDLLPLLCRNLPSITVFLFCPDWVVLVQQNGEKKLYFVLETKGNIDMDALRPMEREKIECGKAHFAALGNGATFLPVDDFGEFMQRI